MQSATSSMSAARSLLADNVAIELKMFAQPAALLFFVSEKLSDREPFERFLEFPFVRRNHTSKRGREFRTQRNFAFAFVYEIEKLLDNFRAAFLFVQLGRFQRRALPIPQSRSGARPHASGRRCNCARAQSSGRKSRKPGKLCINYPSRLINVI